MPNTLNTNSFVFSTLKCDNVKHLKSITTKCTTAGYFVGGKTFFHAKDTAFHKYFGAKTG